MKERLSPSSSKKLMSKKKKKDFLKNISIFFLNFAFSNLIIKKNFFIQTIFFSGLIFVR